MIQVGNTYHFTSQTHEKYKNYTPPKRSRVHEISNECQADQLMRNKQRSRVHENIKWLSGLTNNEEHTSQSFTLKPLHCEQKKNAIANYSFKSYNDVDTTVKSSIANLQSPSVADYPLRSATDHRVGKLLPHQLANQTQTPPQVDSSFCSSAYGVLAAISSCCPPPRGRFLRVTHPSATGNTTYVITN